MESNILISEIKKVSNIGSELKEKFGLEYNPFPKSGIAYIGESEEITSQLSPAYKQTALEIVSYMQDALEKAGDKKTPDYLSLIIRGEFGSGKTQTLMYIKYLFSAIKTDIFNPYVVYIDNPGGTLSELIGAVMSQIGIENFRRYLWDGFIKYMSQKEKKERRRDLRYIEAFFPNTEFVEIEELGHGGLVLKRPALFAQMIESL